MVAPQERRRPLVSEQLWTSVQHNLTMRPRVPGRWKSRSLLAGTHPLRAAWRTHGWTEKLRTGQGRLRGAAALCLTGRIGGPRWPERALLRERPDPAVDGCVVWAVSDLLSRRVGRNVVGLEIGKALSETASTDDATPASRDRLLGFALRLVDGSIDANCFQRRRRKLLLDGNPFEPGVAPLRKISTMLEGIADTTHLSGLGSAHNERDLDRERVVLQQLIAEVPPVRRGRGVRCADSLECVREREIGSARRLTGVCFCCGPTFRLSGGKLDKRP